MKTTPHSPANFFELVDMVCDQMSPYLAKADPGQMRKGPKGRYDTSHRIRNPDGTFYQVGQPLSNIAAQNEADPNEMPLFGQFVDPRLEQPETTQTSVGWSHELSPSTVFSADYVHIDGRKLNQRPRLNVRLTGTTTRRSLTSTRTHQKTLANGRSPSSAAPIRSLSSVSRSTSRYPCWKTAA